MLLFSLLLSSNAQECPQTMWDVQSEWSDISDQVALSKKEQVAALEAYMFTLEGEDEERKGIRTDGMIVFQHGQILYENYGRGFTADNKHLLWSITKGINSTLLGRAVHEGLMDIDEPICTYYANVPAENCRITSKHLVSFASGLDWAETYEGETYQKSSVMAMLMGVGRYDMASFVANHPAKHAPGEAYVYSTGDAVLLSAVIAGAVETTYGEEFPWAMLFDPLGVRATFERDPAGTYVGGSYAYMTPRELAKLGAFYLNDGCIGNDRLLPAGWVESSYQPSEYYLAQTDCCEDSPRGYSWVSNASDPVVGYESELPDVPEDMYYTAGHWGQYMFVIPSWDVIIVRLGDDRDDTRDNNTMVSLAMQLAEPPSVEEQ